MSPEIERECIDCHKPFKVVEEVGKPSRRVLCDPCLIKKVSQGRPKGKEVK